MRISFSQKVSSTYINRSIRKIIAGLAKMGKLRLLLSVSPAPIVETRSLIDIIGGITYVPTY